MTFFDYEKNILKESTQEGLLITAKGLNLNNLISETIKYFCQPFSMSFIINYNEQDLIFLRKKIKSENFYVIDSETSKRTKIYERGGVFVVKSQSLLTDFLNKNVDVKKVTALFVLNCEFLRKNSRESFLIHILKSFSTKSIIKGFCDNPILLSQKFYPLNKTLDILKVRNVSFYPRFRNEVTEDYEKNKIDNLTTESSLKFPIEYEEVQLYLILILKDIAMDISRKEKVLDFESVGYNVELLFRQEKKFKSRKEFESYYRFCVLFSFLYFDIKIFSEYLQILEHLKEENCDCANFKLLKEASRISDKKSKKQEKLSKILQESEGIIVVLCENNIIRMSLSAEYGGTRNYSDDSDETSNDLDEPFENFFSQNLKDKTKRLKVKGRITSLIFLTHKGFRNYTEKYDKVILMSPDLRSTRIAERRNVPIVIMFFRNTIEEEKYYKELREEKECFENLIKERANIPRSLDVMESEYENEILVDYRELRSSLPFQLYKKGYKLNVKLLDTGDFIISGDVAIERKSAPDFLASIRGRLYSQLKNMTFKYKNAYILIEFPERPDLLSLENKDMPRQMILQKFIVLILSFEIKVLYSLNDNMTCCLFKQIENKSSPIKETFAPDVFNPDLQEILMCITGINSSNFNKIFKFENLKDLVNSSRERLKNIFLEAGDDIYNFLNKKLL